MTLISVFCHILGCWFSYFFDLKSVLHVMKFICRSDMNFVLVQTSGYPSRRAFAYFTFTTLRHHNHGLSIDKYWRIALTVSDLRSLRRDVVCVTAIRFEDILIPTLCRYWADASWRQISWRSFLRKPPVLWLSLISIRFFCYLQSFRKPGGRDSISRFTELTFRRRRWKVIFPLPRYPPDPFPNPSLTVVYCINETENFHWTGTRWFRKPVNVPTSEKLPLIDLFWKAFTWPPKEKI